MKILKTEKQIKKFLGEIPLQSASFRVTQGCNLHCRHCYAKGGKRLDNELSFEEIKSLLTQLKELGTIRIFFTGGEPFLRSDFIDILKEAEKEGFSIYLSTNSLLLNEYLINKISKIKITRFQISVDGIEKTHDELRGMKGAYKTAIEKVKMLRKMAPKLPLTMAMTLTKTNAKEVKELRKIAEKIGVNDFAIIPMITAGRAADENLELSPKKLSEIFSEEGSKTVKNTRLDILCSPGVIKNNENIGFGCGFICTFPNILGIAANGDLFPCDGLIGIKKLMLGNLRINTLRECWEGSIMKKLRSIEFSSIKGVCQKCRYSELCSGGCRAMSFLKNGDFFHSDPLCQEFYKKKLFPLKNLYG